MFMISLSMHCSITQCIHILGHSFSKENYPQNRDITRIRQYKIIHVSGILFIHLCKILLCLVSNVDSTIRY